MHQPESTEGPRALAVTTTAVYVISVAAELCGVHPQTLRAWERSGIVRPQRSSGGARRYSDADIALAREVQELLAQGVSVAGVRHILALREELAAAHERIAELEGRVSRRR